MTNDTFTPHSTRCTEIQAGYQIDKLWRYPTKCQCSPEYISIHCVERLAEIHIGWQQPSAEITWTLSADTERLGCETRLLVAPVILA